MREILFKAKRNDTGEWVYGDLTRNRRTGNCYIVSAVCECAHPYRVDTETVCVYIGKDDGKGNEIWSHDVIAINTYDYMEPANDFFGEVVYCEAWACWCIKQPGDEKPIPLCECEGSYKTEICVLGNSIDNPEMLEVE